MPGTVLQAADLNLDVLAHTLERAERPIYLRRKEWQLLVFLLHHRGQLVTREMLLDHLWQNCYDIYPNVIDVHIKNLRAKIDKPFAKRLIKTIHGWGYRLEA